ncbi:ABC transporter ATP-binding protein [Aliikangiella marina]|uniref:ABC transporter ATP-binding protein n=1 Tax=Aliikangiella marina TaxID=1712262 RepID=A0A545TD08_9GAMM|nr:ABC transporter ATP-binding protein [Aliikangiella marina]TQV75100.1 ABC transporter ATP-binding protein [Aliikangiella marina]
MSSPILSVTNFSKSYADAKVLDSLNFEINQGDIVALLGRNGAGKSTLLESIMNLRNGDQGQVLLWGNKWDNLSQAQREKISFVAQETAGFEWMKVDDFLTYLGGFFPSWDANYCQKLVHKWNLDPKQRVGDLSGGQSQILHVIQALSVKPDLMILDEPVAHLDPNIRRQFLGELVELTCEIGSTVIFSSHIVSDLERVANKVALLMNGEIQHYYDVEELKASIAHVKISTEAPLQQTEEFSSLINWTPIAGGATATIATPMKQTLDEFKNNHSAHIEIIPMSLEDWYLEVCHATD